RLGRNAPPVEADAPQPLPLDDRDLEAQLRGANRAHIAAGPGAEDDEIELVSHGSNVLRLTPLPLREREGPKPQAWEGEGLKAPRRSKPPPPPIRSTRGCSRNAAAGIPALAGKHRAAHRPCCPHVASRQPR